MSEIGTEMLMNKIGSGESVSALDTSFEGAAIYRKKGKAKRRAVLPLEVTPPPRENDLLQACNFPQGQLNVFLSEEAFELQLYLEI